MRNKRGQAVIEMVLLMAVIVTISLMVTRYLQQSQFAQKLVSQPWVTLSGMVECGVWSGCDRNSKHPGAVNRILSLRPNE